MTIKRQACIAGALEHPLRKAPDKTTAQLHAECARGALADAGLIKDVDGYFCSGDAPGIGSSAWSTTSACACAMSTPPRRAARPTWSHVAMRRRRSPPAIATSRSSRSPGGRAARRPSGTAPAARPDVPEVPFEAPYAHRHA